MRSRGRSKQGGLVWVFHLRKKLRWSDDRRLTAQDVRRSWLRALSPATEAPLAGPDLGIVRGARAYHAAGRGPVGIEAPDNRTLRVTLQHPIPWLDQLVAHPIAAAYRPNAYSGPFQIVGRNVLGRNFDYWNADAVKPSRLVLTTKTKGADAILPRGLNPPGLPWVETAKRPRGSGWRRLPTLSIQLLWNASRPGSYNHGVGGLVPLAMPGWRQIASTGSLYGDVAVVPAGRVTLGYTKEDALAPRAIAFLRRQMHLNLTLQPHGSLAELTRARRSDLVLLGWSSKIFDAYNIFDLFPCGSAFNVAHWCDPSYDALMRRAVRTMDDHARWQIERQILAKLEATAPAAPLIQPSEYVRLKPGVRGFSWSPIGFYELSGLTRS